MKTTTLPFGLSDEGAPIVPPLDSQVVWSRTDPPGTSTGHSSELLSLVAENHQVNSYSWPLYVQVSATDAPKATQSTSQSTGTNVRLWMPGVGSPWAAGSHVEVHFGKDQAGKTTPANGTAIGVNVELERVSTNGEVVGLEINAADSPKPPDAAIEIQGKFKNAIRLPPGQRILLDAGDGTESCWISYNPSSKRVEIWRAGSRVLSV